MTHFVLPKTWTPEEYDQFPEDVRRRLEAEVWEQVVQGHGFMTPKMLAAYNAIKLSGSEDVKSIASEHGIPVQDAQEVIDYLYVRAGVEN